MCVLAIIRDPGGPYPLMIVQNRDEAYSRPSRSAYAWPTQPIIYGGQDLQQGGTWLGITETGRLASLLNHPFTGRQVDQPVSRGLIVRDYLLGQDSALDYIQHIRHDRDDYEPFHLVLGDLEQVYYYSHLSDELRPLEVGIEVFSNTRDHMSGHRIDRARDLLSAYLDQNSHPLGAELLKLFQDQDQPDILRTYPEDLNHDQDRNHASLFIKGEEFGTVSQTAIIVDHQGRAQLTHCLHPMAEDGEFVGIDFEI